MAELVASVDPEVHPILQMTDAELAARAEIAQRNTVIALDVVRANVSLGNDYEFLVTTDNPLLMGCLGWLGEFPELMQPQTEPLLWDILEGVLMRQVRMLSAEP